MKKPWDGRFKEATLPSVEKFTESLSFDQRLYSYDILGSIAHADMLGKSGFISQSNAEKIIKGLNDVLKDIETGQVAFDPKFEDIHMLVEHLLTEKIGVAGKELHTARSRNDQVATDMRLWLKDAGNKLIERVRQLQLTLLKKAAAGEKLLMPGFTHLQHAQPVGVAFYLLAFIEKFDRDISRLEDCLKRADVLPLGACALAGTTLDIDRKHVAKALGFSTISRNAMDTVSDRDFIIEYVFALSLISTHISNFCEDMIIWASAEYGYIIIDDGYCTGSSIMPQKKNPDVHELLRGKSARVYGALYALMTLMKGLPQAYNRDMQEDKERAFDAHDTVSASVNILAEVIDHTNFNKERLMDSATKGFMEATAMAEYLVARGVFFRDAHHIVGRIVQLAETSNEPIADLDLEDMKKICPEIEKDVFEILSCDKILDRVSSQGGTGRAEIRNNLGYWQKVLG